MLLWRVVRKKMSLIRNYAQSPWPVSSPPARFYPPFFFSVGGGPAVFFNTALYWFWRFIPYSARPAGQWHLRFVSRCLQTGPLGVFPGLPHRAAAFVCKVYFCSTALTLPPPHPPGHRKATAGASGSAGPCGVAFHDGKSQFSPACPLGYDRQRAGKQRPFCRGGITKTVLFLVYSILYITSCTQKAHFLSFSSAALHPGCFGRRARHWHCRQQKNTAAFAAVFFVFFVLQPKGVAPPPLCVAIPI